MESTPETHGKPHTSLQKKTAARIAAVQCLYTLSVGGGGISPAQQLLILKKQLSGNKEEQKVMVGAPLEPNYKLVQTLLEGIDKWRRDIDSRLDSVLSTDWKRERMSPLLIAILQCGIFELFFDKDMSPKIVVAEYTRLTRSFFADGEVNFVHASLQKLSQKFHG